MRCIAFVIRVVAIGAGLLPAIATAQEFQAVSSPYQGAFAYTIGAELVPGVEVDAIRWHLLRVSTKSPDDIPSGKAVKTLIFMDFENTGTEDAQVSVVILFEDGQGNSLDRIECDPERVRRGETRSLRQKFKIQGDVLRATQKLYLFCEVNR